MTIFNEQSCCHREWTISVLVTTMVSFCEFFLATLQNAFIDFTIVWPWDKHCISAQHHRNPTKQWESAWHWIEAIVLGLQIFFRPIVMTELLFQSPCRSRKPNSHLLLRFFAWILCHRWLVAGKLDFPSAIWSSTEEQTAAQCMFNFSVKISCLTLLKLQHLLQVLLLSDAGFHVSYLWFSRHEGRHMKRESSSTDDDHFFVTAKLIAALHTT